MLLPRVRGFLLEQLNRQVNAGRSVHALIFEGPEGTGKHTAARWMAQGLNCTAHGKKPCGRCASCRRFDDGNAPELLRLEPDGETKKSIKIEAARALLDEVYLKPEGRVKCIVVSHAELMTVQAQNALLKTLEETPEYAVFFLLTDRSSALLPTIRSRCACLRFAPLREQEVEDFLLSQGFEGQSAKEAALLSGGSIGRALEIARDPSIQSAYNKLCDAFKEFMSLKDVSAVSAQLTQEKIRPDFLADALEKSASELLRGQARLRLSKQLQLHGHDGARLMKAVITFNQMRSASINPQYALDMLLYNIPS